MAIISKRKYHMTSKDCSPNQNIACLLHDTARLMRRDFNRRAQKLGLTQAQWQALAVLSHNEGINQAAMSELLEVQPISLARLIDRLEANGWVERRAHPSDRRAVSLYLTEKVEPILAEMGKLVEETQAEALRGINEDERVALMQVLGRIKQNLLGDDLVLESETREAS